MEVVMYNTHKYVVLDLITRVSPKKIFKKESHHATHYWIACDPRLAHFFYIWQLYAVYVCCSSRVVLLRNSVVWKYVVALFIIQIIRFDSQYIVRSRRIMFIKQSLITGKLDLCNLLRTYGWIFVGHEVRTRKLWYIFQVSDSCRWIHTLMM